ncbi:MAG: AbrB/MazE/SpoVT family DNA-binding domain-containing protein [Lachnospiraceae bacterium]|nr:AbrB/MazE/SpoVT family DNA-binding domain-containing protein [Lachnospiraceae bacterium]
MRATGVIRAVDKLGRIVIPKEIRKNFRIKEGDPMEIFTAREGEIVLKKYSPLGEMTNFAKAYAKAMADITKMTVFISDRDQIIASEGKLKKEYENRNLSQHLESVMEQRKEINTCKETRLRCSVYEGESVSGKKQLIYPIISQGDVVGTVGLISEDKNKNFDEFEEKIIRVAVTYFGSLFI